MGFGLASGYGKREKPVAVTRLLYMSTAQFFVPISMRRGTYFFESFSLSTGARILVSISAALGQKIVLVGAMVAENDTGGGEVKDGYTSANGSARAVPVADHGWIRLGDIGMFNIVQRGLSRHSGRCRSRACLMGFCAVEERLHLGCGDGI